MSIIGNVVGGAIGINLINGKLKPKKRGIGTYIGLFVFGILIVAFFIGFILGIFALDIEFILIGGIGFFSSGYLFLISPYTQNPNNYFLKVQNPNSFDNFELYYKNKKVELKYAIDNNGKFKWANNNAKLECVSYSDNSNINNFTKYKIINYFSRWLLDNDYLSEDVTVTFEKL